MDIEHFYFNTRGGKDGIRIFAGNPEPVKIHVHDFNELVIILDGKADHYVNDSVYKVSKGDVFVFKGSDLHGFGSEEGLVICNIAYENYKLEYIHRELRNSIGYHSLFVIEPIYRNSNKFQSMLHLTYQELSTVNQIIALMVKEYGSDTTGSYTLITAYFMQLVVYLSRLYSNSERHADDSLIMIAKAVSYLEKNYIEKISLQYLANLANLSISQFCKVFSKAYGMSPGKYIINLRIQKACSLLKNKCTIAEAAYQCGFNDSNYFTRLFKKNMGKTPRAFKAVDR